MRQHERDAGARGAPDRCGDAEHAIEHAVRDRIARRAVRGNAAAIEHHDAFGEHGRKVEVVQHRNDRDAARGAPAERKRKREKKRKERAGPKQQAASGEPNSTGPRAIAASGVGPGRSQADSNYRGLVSAHLARHKRFPPEARSGGQQGRATVSFALDGGGRVTRVSLVRASGVASLDQEATAMVRRASPFPAPPNVRGMSFTVPVDFRIQ
jgi:TonB family protein